MLFRKYIALHFEQDVQDATEKLRRLLDSLCLRRTTTLLELPEIVEFRRDLSLTDGEKNQYETTSRLMAQVIKQRANDASGKSNPFGLFQAQLQLRILCNHGTFQKQFSWTRPRDFLLEREDAVATLGRDGEVKCSLCNERTSILSTTRPAVDIQHCGHILCQECASQQAERGGNDGYLLKCRLCRTADSELTQSCAYDPKFCYSKAKLALQGDGYFNSDGFSTKMVAIMADLEEDQFKSKRFVLHPRKGNLGLTIMVIVLFSHAGQDR
jgi:SWI/SNF-related matrix-associated actin-dependent regulator of chromatin subfamily A3